MRFALGWKRKRTGVFFPRFQEGEKTVKEGLKDTWQMSRYFTTMREHVSRLSEGDIAWRKMLSGSEE